MRTVSLHDIAPRLARARDALLVERRRERTRRRRHRDRELDLERLVSHRELQFLRAGVTRSSSYVAERDRKLKAAQRKLAEHRRAA